MQAWRRAGVCAVVVWCSAWLSLAQTPLSASGFDPRRTTSSVAPFEHVDPFSGNLLLTFTDLVLPGNAGFHLAVQRVYNSKIHPRYEDTVNHFKLRTWVGLGWSLHFGRVVQSQSTTPGETVVEMSDGSGHALYNALDPSNPFGAWVTPTLGRYNKATHTLRQPNGLIYTFGHVGIPNGPEGVVRYVTEIRDPYNNRLTFEYFASVEGPTDGVKRIIQHLGNGQTREVTFAVIPIANGYALASMTYAGRTWTYTHALSPYGSGLVLLQGTTAPVAGNAWTFAYLSVSPGPVLTAVTGPLGGRLEYTHANVNRPVDTTTIPMLAVTERRTVASGVTQGTWTFAYTAGAQQNTTVITTPCGQRETYTYHGIGTLGPDMGAYAAWLVGALQRSTTETSAGAILEERVFG